MGGIEQYANLVQATNELVNYLRNQIAGLEKQNQELKDRFEGLCDAADQWEERYIKATLKIAELQKEKRFMAIQQCEVCKGTSIKKDSVYHCQKCSTFYDKNGNQI